LGGVEKRKRPKRPHLSTRGGVSRGRRVARVAKPGKEIDAGRAYQSIIVEYEGGEVEIRNPPFGK